MSQMPSSPTIKPNCLKGRTNSLSDSVAESFDKYIETWKLWYPGLSLAYLKNHFYEYCGKIFSYENFYQQWFGGEIQHHWLSYCEQLNTGVPLAYLTKSAFFFESEFFVDGRVLIPRFETEILLEQIFNVLNELDKKLPCHAIKIAEVGVGPGTISLSLAQKKYTHPLHILAGDLSDEALEVCRVNAFRLGLALPKQNKLDLIQSDRLENFSGTFDLIYSNPPYIKRKSDFEDVHIQVAQYEPEMALFLEDGEYEQWFERFFKQVGQLLVTGGFFLMEGHENHLELLLHKIKKTFPCQVELIKDLTGRNRILKIRKNNG